MSTLKAFPTSGPNTRCVPAPRVAPAANNASSRSMARDTFGRSGVKLESLGSVFMASTKRIAAIDNMAGLSPAEKRSLKDDTLQTALELIDGTNASPASKRAFKINLTAQYNRSMR